MHLKQLTLTQYKNFSSASFDFNPNINCFVGENGVGKSNILDAIYHLSFCKSYFNPISVQNIQIGTDFFMIKGTYKKKLREEKIICSFKKGQKKIIKRNGNVYKKISEHIGMIPTVIISPADRDIIIDGSNTRRKFIDSVIGQTDLIFLNNLLEYNKILSQRNSLLKYFALNKAFDQDTLEIYNNQLVERSHLIFEKRKAFVDDFVPTFTETYKKISQKNENATLSYESQLKFKNHSKLLVDSIEKDQIFQYTTTGIHKDDIALSLNGKPIKKFGSQGQQKTFLIALKLAQFNFLENLNGFSPLLLFDDAFDKLDQKRVTQILSLVDQNYFGQIFITDTHEERIIEALKNIKSTYEIFRL